MSDRSFTDRVRTLNLPLNQIIVIASGVLDAYGIRAADDIDLAVSPELFATFESDPDWAAHSAEWGERYYRNGECEAWSGWTEPGKTRPLYEDLLADTIEIDGIRFMTLDYVRRWKVIKGRDKDKKDIALIDEYLSQHTHDE